MIEWIDSIRAIKETDRPVKYVLWRQTKLKQYEFMLVDLKDIEFDDLFYIETKQGYKGYSRLMDFVRHSDGSISNWQFTPSGLTKDQEKDMLQRVKQSLQKIDSKANNFYVLVCLKQE